MDFSLKTTLKLFALALALSTGLVSVPSTVRAQSMAQAGEIRIVVSRVRNQNGSVICQLWASTNSAKFPKTGTELRRMSAPIQGGQGVCEFKALPADTYAFSVFHDENGDGKFSRRFGYPLEGYGFSNNVNPQFSAPSFNECEVQYVGKDVLTVPVDLIYR